MEKSKYFTSLDYYSRNDAKMALAEFLMEQQGWKVLGYRPTTSDPDPGADYTIQPGSWAGIATYGDFVLVVDVSDQRNSGKEIKKETQEYEPCDHCLETGEEPNGFTYDEACKEPERFWSEQDKNGKPVLVIHSEDGYVPREFFNDDGNEKCQTCRGTANVYSHTTSVVIGHWPTYQANPQRKGWHLEKDGKIITSGQSIARMYYGYWEGHHPEQKEEVQEQCRLFVQALQIMPLKFLSGTQRSSTELNESKPELSPVHSNGGALEIIDYSERSIALRGVTDPEATKPYSEKLGRKGMNGAFNKHLTDPATGNKFIGWIFSKKRRPEVEAFLQSL
jgi:hypothetical protein